MDGQKEARYGNWVSKRIITTLAALAAVWTVMEVLVCVRFGGYALLKVLLGLLAAFFIVAALYACYARRLFARDNGEIQRRVLETLASRVNWTGEGTALDIGCGSGALTIRIAKRYPQAKAVGIDTWGSEWEYSQKQCEENAEAEGVTERTKFIRARAGKIPVPDETFDLVVSNMTFHEVKDGRDKTDAVREALRVLKKGGTFAFQDLFFVKAYFGMPDTLLAAVKEAGVRDARLEDTGSAAFIPRALRFPFMLGKTGVLYGKK